MLPGTLAKLISAVSMMRKVRRRLSADHGTSGT
jgi:hypothetical protein